MVFLTHRALQVTNLANEMAPFGAFGLVDRSKFSTRLARVGIHKSSRSTLFAMCVGLRVAMCRAPDFKSALDTRQEGDLATKSVRQSPLSAAVVGPFCRQNCRQDLAAPVFSYFYPVESYGGDPATRRRRRSGGEPELLGRHL